MTRIKGGNTFFASYMFIPVLIPKRLASYEAVVMTVLPPEPIIPIGLPLKQGLVCCSTEAKKASMSAQRIIFDIMVLLFQEKRCRAYYVA